MLLYWRKNEKDELAARKKADKEALDRAKAEEEARESKRQARKLNFLLTQTELYSHFIGKKIKTHEAEDTAEASTGPPEPKGAEHVNEEIGIGADGEVLPDIDYDDGALFQSDFLLHVSVAARISRSSLVLAVSYSRGRERQDSG